MSLTSTSCLKDLGGGGTTYHPTGLRRGCPGAGGRCLGGLWVVCSRMVIRKGSCPHPSGTFKVWVKPDWVFPACLPACLAWGHVGVSIPQSLCQRHCRVSKLWPYFTRMLVGDRPAEHMADTCHHTCLVAWVPRPGSCAQGPGDDSHCSSACCEATAAPAATTAS